MLQEAFKKADRFPIGILFEINSLKVKEDVFILSSGCSVPVDAEFENVKALVETGKNYYPHHRVFAGGKVI